MSARIVPVVLAGGSGSRLWPMSRRLLPKQFLPLVGEQTLFQQTLLRVQGLTGCGAPLVIANSEHRFLAADQLKEIDSSPRTLMLEPVGRGTAPAIAAAALSVQRDDPEAILLVLPSDHLILDLPAFHETIRVGAACAAQGYLATFGITPDHPATGYGYIEIGEPLGERTFKIRRFVEKPSLEKARSFLERGYLWNSGMFLLGASRFLEELERLQPQVVDAVRQSLDKATSDLDFLRLDAVSFSACPSVSIDYGVMEGTRAGAVVRTDMRWSDVGSWAQLWAVGNKDGAGNVARGDVAVRDSKGCYVLAADRHVSLLGVNDLIVVETDDAILVAARNRAEDVKELVEKLERGNRSEHVSHSRVYRPWGYYENVDAGRRFQVKRLMIKPGHKLSLQLHQRRAEHWVVVSGRARVTRGDETFVLESNQSTFIPVAIKHRLENAGAEPLLIVEVQSGDYLGEDDIVRLEDRYNRA